MPSIPPKQSILYKLVKTLMEAMAPCQAPSPMPVRVCFLFEKGDDIKMNFFYFFKKKRSSLLLCWSAGYFGSDALG
jgi:hypothetical protein